MKIRRATGSTLCAVRLLDCQSGLVAGTFLLQLSRPRMQGRLCTPFTIDPNLNRFNQQKGKEG
eukprot:1156718-Pelagomonas_calceolata.AAC.1